VIGENEERKRTEWVEEKGVTELTCGIICSQKGITAGGERNPPSILEHRCTTAIQYPAKCKIGYLAIFTDVVLSDKMDL